MAFGSTHREGKTAADPMNAAASHYTPGKTKIKISKYRRCPRSKHTDSLLRSHLIAVATQQVHSLAACGALSSSYMRARYTNGGGSHFLCGVYTTYRAPTRFVPPGRRTATRLPLRAPRPSIIPCTNAGARPNMQNAARPRDWSPLVA